MTLLNLDGYTEVPAGKIAAIVTHLDMVEANQWRANPPSGVDLIRVPNPDLTWYRQLFLEIGEEWLWFSRLMMHDEDLAKILSEPDRELYVARDNGSDAGLLELNFADKANAEIAFFGLVPSAVGRHIGRWLMGEALAICWARETTKRVWLHTCTLDHPNALPFYMKCGFNPHRRTIEVADDPRLNGAIPRSAGGRHPLISLG